MTTKEDILKRCKGRPDESYATLTVDELKAISEERPDLAGFVKVKKKVKDLKELCNAKSPAPSPATK